MSAQANAALERSAFTKIAWRLMPLLSVAYVLNYMDRNNVGFAALGMNREVGLSATQFGTGAGILFLGYCFFEVPSNAVLYRVGARIWIGRIMITWGLISAATIFVTGAKSWYFLRFLLGVAEAGYFPGIVFYLATWFPAEYRGRMLAWFVLGIPVSSVVGAPISGLLLNMDGIGGLSGWKWLFLLEGLPVVLLGVASPWVLTDKPEDAGWLAEDERAAVRARIAGERREREVHHLLTALKDPRVLILTGIEFGFTVGSYGVGIWLPQIVKAANFSNFKVGLIVGICYLLASIQMLVWAAHVDKSGKKVLNLALACVMSTGGLLFAVLSHHFWTSLAWVTVGVIGITAVRAIFWTIPTSFLTGMAAAGGLAVMNSVATIGGFVGPFVMGWLKDRTHSYSAGLIMMAGSLLASTVLSWSLKLFVAQE